MKAKKNKKIYNFTKKQRQRDQNARLRGCEKAPKCFVRRYTVSFRVNCKAITYYNYVNGTEQTYPLSGRHTANWDYW